MESILSKPSEWSVSNASNKEMGEKVKRKEKEGIGDVFENEEKIITVNEKDIENRLYERLKKRELPDYFLYTGAGGAKNWLELDGSEKFPVARKLKSILEDNIASIVRLIPEGMNLVSVGVGSGEKERILLKELIKKNLAEKSASETVSTRYYPIDISNQFIDIAVGNVRDLPVEKKGIVGFIEDIPLLKQYWSLPVLFCILGNTFCNHEPEFIFQLIYETLGQTDLLLFDANLFPSESSDKETQFARRAVLDTYASRENELFNMHPLLQYGMLPEKFDFEISLGDVESRIGTLYRTRKSLNILKDAEIRVGHDTINFKKGEVIRMGFTYKYTYEQITSLLKIYGFEILNVFLSEDRTNTVLLAKKRFLK